MKNLKVGQIVQVRDIEKLKASPYLVRVGFPDKGFVCHESTTTLADEDHLHLVGVHLRVVGVEEKGNRARLVRVDGEVFTPSWNYTKVGMSRHVLKRVKELKPWVYMSVDHNEDAMQ